MTRSLSIRKTSSDGPSSGASMWRGCHCGGCGGHVQGRHPLQTSDALGAAHVQVGPQALTLAAHMSKEMGISHERAAQVLDGVTICESAEAHCAGRWRG